MYLDHCKQTQKCIKKYKTVLILAVSMCFFCCWRQTVGQVGLYRIIFVFYIQLLCICGDYIYLKYSTFLHLVGIVYAFRFSSAPLHCRQNVTIFVGLFSLSFFVFFFYFFHLFHLWQVHGEVLPTSLGFSSQRRPKVHQ